MLAFDPTTGTIPFPNDLLRNAETGLVTLPTSGSGGLADLVVQILNTRRGFSTAAPTWMRVYGPPLNASTVTRDNVVVARAASKIGGVKPLADTAYEVEYDEDLHTVFVRYQRPLEPALTDFERVTLLNDPAQMIEGVRAVVVVTDDVRSQPIREELEGVAAWGALPSTPRLEFPEGLPLMPPPVIKLLLANQPLLVGEGEDQVSSVEQLDLATAQQLEPARLAYNALKTGVGLPSPLGLGIGLEDIAMAFGYSPDAPTVPLQQLRALLMARLNLAPTPVDCGGDGCLTGDRYVLDPGPTYTPPGYPADQSWDLSNVAAIQLEGEIRSFNFQAPDGMLLPPDGVMPMDIGVTVFVPKEVAGQCEAPFGVAIAQHGLGGDRLSYALSLANTLAAPEYCLATVAIDAVGHGGLTRGSMPATTLHPRPRPATSGENFLSLNLVANQTNFYQSVLNLVVLAEAIDDGGLQNLFRPTDVDPDGNSVSMTIFRRQAGYVGTSLGSLLGTMFLAVDPQVKTGVLNVPAGFLADALAVDTMGMPLSSVGAGLVAQLMAAGLMPGTFAWEQSVALLQFQLDPYDPINYGLYLQREPPAVPDMPGRAATLNVLAFNPATMTVETTTNFVPQKEILVQRADPDPAWPLGMTERLAATIGVDLTATTFPEAGHSFLISDTDAGRCSRRQVAAWLSSGLRGGAVLPDPLKTPTCL